MFAAIRKLVVAVVGLAVLLLHRWFGVDLAGMEAMLVDLIIAGLTALGVYAVPNDDDKSRA